MDANTDILIVLGIGLLALLGSARLLFWARRWRTSRWFKEFSHNFTDLETKNELCTELAARCFNSLSRDGHRGLYEVSSFVAHIQDALPVWQDIINSTTSTVEVEALCDRVEMTLTKLTNEEEYDPIDLMMTKLQSVASELVQISDHIEATSRLGVSRMELTNTRRLLMQYGLVGDE
jgi:hypothetical protein